MNQSTLPLCDWTAFDLVEALWRGEISSAEITAAVWERIDAVESGVGAYLTLCREAAAKHAREADDRIAAARRGGRRAPPAGPLGAYTGRPWGPPVEGAAAVELGPLTGIPGALKDNLCTAGVLTTCGSRILHNFVPPYDATVVARLKEIAAPLLGKTNMDEFAMGSSTENSAFKPTRNPFDLKRVPGGSSGGSAAAVAAGEAIFGLGSDTGGSIRQPASFCGVVGLKPTYGRVSRFGLVAFASSLDQIGPLTRDVRDAALVMNALAGYDPCDSTSVDRSVPDYLAALGRGVKGLRIGLPKEYFAEGLEPAVRTAVLATLDALTREGAEVVELDLPHTEYAVACYYLVAPAEASSNLARYDGVRYGLRVDAPDVATMFEKTRSEGFGAEVKRRIMLGTYALSSGYYDAYYLKALQVRTLIRRDFEQAFERCDLLATPTSPTLPFSLGEKTQDPLQMYLSDVYTIPVNLAGLPAISLPCALAEGLPVGLQLIAPPFGEERLFQAAAAAERLVGLAPLRAPVAAGGGRS